MDDKNPQTPQSELPETEQELTELEQQVTQTDFSPLDMGELDLESIIEEFRSNPVAAQESDDLADTIRLDKPLQSKAEEAPIAQLPPEQPTPEEPEAPPQEPDPDWEPELPPPAPEYTPPQPILFQPNARRKELKKKLVAGPEKRYYRLSELGTGRLQVLLILSAIVAMLCIGSTVLYHLGMVQDNRMKLMVFGQCLAMLFSALFGSFQLIEGVSDLVRKRFSLNTLLVFSFLICCVDGAMCLQTPRVPCCAPFSLQVFFSLLDTLYRRRTELSQMDTLRRATDLTAIRTGNEKVDGYQVMLRTQGQLEDFWEQYPRPGKAEKLLRFYSLCSLIAAVAVGIVAGILHGVQVGFQVAAVTVLAATPATFFISHSRPADILEKRFKRTGTLICGWEGMNAASGKVIYPLSHADLFPAGTVKMNGVKYFGTRDPDEVVAYGTALITASQSGLAPLFTQILDSRNCYHLSATQLAFHDGGITGDVRGEAVTVGSLSFLREQGIEIPDNLKVTNAVCVAVGQTLCGLFAISYEKTHYAANGLHSLCGYPRLIPTVADGDFLLNAAFMKARFGVNPKRLRIADAQTRQAIAALEPDTLSPAVVLATQDNLSALAYGVTGARSLHRSCYLGLAIHMAGGILGIGIMLALTLLGATWLLTPMHILLYQLIWCVPGLLATEWTRLI